MLSLSNTLDIIVRGHGQPGNRAIKNNDNNNIWQLDDDYDVDDDDDHGDDDHNHINDNSSSS